MIDKLHPTKIILDEETGEIEYITESEYKHCKESREKHFKGVDGKPNYTKSKNELHKFIDVTCGSFYFNYYEGNQCCNQFDFRFIYLCTYMNYENRLVLGKSKDDSKLMTKKDLFEVLNISEKETYRTIEYLEENKLIEINDKFISISKDKCIKGSLDKEKKVMVRMFDDAIQELYLNSKAKEHKKLALLIKLLPLIHFDLNVVSKNPQEREKCLVESYTLTELAKEMGYSTTQKLRKGLMDITVGGEYVIMLAKVANKEMIVVNPKIYYKGNKIDEMKGIISLFKLAN